MKQQIPIADSIPRRRNRVFRFFGNAIYHVLGWRITGSIPDVPKFVLSGGPHTSNWDFIFALAACWALELKIHWIGKHTIFRWPVNGLFRYFGGIPVDRRKPGTLFRDVIHGFENNDGFIFALSPEGTRSKVKRFKPGFHRIALKAGVPIIPAGVDFEKKTLEFGPVIEVTEDFDAVSDALRAYWATCVPRFPDQY